MIELKDFDDYQLEARKTAIYPNLGSNLWYPTLGLAGEAGEVAEKVKKIYRDHNGKLNLDVILDISKELGDVLWYVANLAEELKVSLSFVAGTNLEKLQSRSERNKVHGEEDNR